MLGVKFNTMEIEYYPLTDEWKIDLDAKRNNASSIIEKYTGKKIKNDKSDIHLIQSVIDAGIIQTDDVVTFQALGVLYGDAISEVINAKWCMTKDEYGDDPTLKVQGKQININALTIISKRIEENREIDLDYILNDLVEYLNPNEFAND